MIDFVDLNLEEKKEILSWRNHQNVKSYMYNSQDILLEQHLSFIESLRDNFQRQYILVQHIGVLVFDFNYQNKSVLFGLYGNPFDKIVGIGTILINTINKYIFNILNLSKLELEVFADNKAIRLYKKFNFQETNRKTVNNKEVICMELIND